MLISYSRPSPITWSLNGTGAAFLTDSARLANGRPTAATRIQWLSGAQTTSSVLKLRGSWVGAGTPRLKLAGLIGTTLPVGLRIVASTYSGGNWTLNPVEGTVMERADGVRVAWFRFPAVGYTADGVQFAIYNDKGGFAVIAADSNFEIGEVWAGPSEEWRIRPAVEFGTEDFSKSKLSISGQRFTIPRRAAKTTQLEFTPVPYDSAFPGTFDSSADMTIGSFDALRARLLTFSPCVVVPIAAAPFTGATAIDQEYVNRHAQFGVATSCGPIVGEAPRFVFSARFQAPPVLLP